MKPTSGHTGGDDKHCCPDCMREKQEAVVALNNERAEAKRIREALALAKNSGISAEDQDRLWQAQRCIAEAESLAVAAQQFLRVSFGRPSKINSPPCGEFGCAWTPVHTDQELRRCARCGWERLYSWSVPYAPPSTSKDEGKPTCTKPSVADVCATCDSPDPVSGAQSESASSVVAPGHAVGCNWLHGACNCDLKEPASTAPDPLSEAIEIAEHAADFFTRPMAVKDDVRKLLPLLRAAQKEREALKAETETYRRAAESWSDDLRDRGVEVVAVMQERDAARAEVESLKEDLKLVNKALGENGPALNYVEEIAKHDRSLEQSRLMLDNANTTIKNLSEQIIDLKRELKTCPLNLSSCTNNQKQKEGEHK